MPVFERHVFVCTRGEWCPSIDGDGIGVHAALKEAVRTAGLADRVRVNHAGCFSQCGNGPMAVVYPEGTWYATVTVAECPEILEGHLPEASRWLASSTTRPPWVPTSSSAIPMGVRAAAHGPWPAID